MNPQIELIEKRPFYMPKYFQKAIKELNVKAVGHQFGKLRHTHAKGDDIHVVSCKCKCCGGVAILSGMDGQVQLSEQGLFSQCR